MAFEVSSCVVNGPSGVTDGTLLGRKPLLQRFSENSVLVHGEVVSHEVSIEARCAIVEDKTKAVAFFLICRECNRKVDGRDSPSALPAHGRSCMHQVACAKT